MKAEVQKDSHPIASAKRIQKGEKFFDVYVFRKADNGKEFAFVDEEKVLKKHPGIFKKK